MHIEGQFELADMVLDTWPTERKHKVFKADLAPRIKHLQEFEKSVLMPWVEHDLDVLIREATAAAQKARHSWTAIWESHSD
jgi:hypothetical protein